MRHANPNAGYGHGDDSGGENHGDNDHSGNDHGGNDHGGGHGPRGAGKVSNLVIFGDSLSDNGNLFAITGGLEPAAPWWEGRFSNGPTYAEQLPALLGVKDAKVQNYAYGGARSVTGNPIPIDLDSQVQRFIASLHGGKAPKGTEAVLYIGNNDYLNYTPSAANPPDAEIAAVVGNIQKSIQTLAANGVSKIVVFTLPHFSITPAGQALAASGAAGAALVAGADAIIDANNAALKQLVAADNAAGLDVKLVDAAVFGDAVAADSRAFGFKDVSVPIFTGDDNTLTGVTSVYAPNEIAFTNDIHPTYAAHGVQAAFAAATLNASNVELYVAGGKVSNGTDGADFIFAVKGGNTFAGGAGADVIYAGNGNNTGRGGTGNDLVFAGGGGNHLFGDSGSDLLAVNSGDNELDGGTGDDILVANRSGNTTLRGGSGDNLIILKEDAGASFGAQSIFGGSGETVVRFIFNDQNAASVTALTAEFQTIVDAFNASMLTNQMGSFTVDGLDVHGITGLQLQLDSVNAANPYQIDHTILQTIGDAPQLSGAGSSLLQQAGLWGLLTA
jgi:phospholipase/lecithinase/hemolysin